MSFCYQSIVISLYINSGFKKIYSKSKETGFENMFYVKVLKVIINNINKNIVY